MDAADFRAELARMDDQFGGGDVIEAAVRLYSEALDRVTALSVPLCVGRQIIGHLARDGQWISEDGRGLIAADELFRHDPYEALEAIKPLVTGQLPMPIKPEMMGRCMRIADIIDAALDAAGGT